MPHFFGTFTSEKAAMKKQNQLKQISKTCRKSIQRKNNPKLNNKKNWQKIFFYFQDFLAFFFCFYHNLLS